MKNNLLFTLFLVFILTPSSKIFAQWEVGVPVDTSLAKLEMVGWGCYPTADHWFVFPVSEADGVDHIIVVLSASQDSVEIEGSIVNAGDTLWITEYDQWEVFFIEGPGTIKLDFRAVGTPTTSGQTVPCEPSDLWISDLQLCFEGLSPTVDFDCEVDESTAVHEVDEGTFDITLPHPANDFELKVTTNNNFKGITVFDIQGRQMAFSKDKSVDCSNLPNGFYLAVVNLDSGQVITEKFVITRK